MPITSEEIIRRMNAKFPLAMRLPDPVTGEMFEVSRDNILSLLVIDMDNLALESQTCAMLYGEMARVHGGAKRYAKKCEEDFRTWKARRSGEARATIDVGLDAKGHKKAVPVGQIEEFYRGHAEYSEMCETADVASVIADLFADLKEAFKLKQRALHSLHGETFGHNEMASKTDRMEEFAAAADEAKALQMMAESGDVLADIVNNAEPHTKAPPKATTKSTKKRATKAKASKK